MRTALKGKSANLQSTLEILPKEQNICNTLQYQTLILSCKAYLHDSRKRGKLSSNTHRFMASGKNNADIAKFAKVFGEWFLECLFRF